MAALLDLVALAAEDFEAIQSEVLRLESERKCSTNHELAGRAAWLAAYCERLTDVCALLGEYTAQLARAVAELGAAPLGQIKGGRGGQAAAISQGQLVQVLASLEQAVLLAAREGTLSIDRLLGMANLGPVPQGPAPVTSVLELLAAGAQADLAEVHSWVSCSGRPDPQNHTHSPGTNTGGSCLAEDICQLQRLQVHRYQRSRQVERQMQELQKKLEVAQVQLAAAGGAGGEATLRKLAARQAGLKTALRDAERLSSKLEAKQAMARVAAEALEEQRGELAAREERERQLDELIRALCTADLRLTRQWRSDAWQARHFLDNRLLARGPGLAVVGSQLAAAWQEELAAFRATPWPQQPGAASSSTEDAALQEAAMLLGYLPEHRTAEYAAELVASAEAELEQLRPLQDQLAGIMHGAMEVAAGKQEEAARTEQELRRLLSEGVAASLQQLQEAEAAVEEGMVGAGKVEEALREWKTCPALDAAPWVKRHDRNARQWLQLLQEQRDALARSGAALMDNSNLCR